MKGKILDYSIQNSTGIISGNDGERYVFGNADWKGDKAPAVGQSVDYVKEDNVAKEIYLDSAVPQFDTDSIKEKFEELHNSDMVNNMLLKKDEMLKAGMQNKFGFILAIITALAMFLPVVEIPYMGTANALDGGGGKLIFVLLLALASFYYMGIKHSFVKVLTAVIVVFAFFQFYDLFSGLSSGNDFIGAFGGRGSRDANFFSLLRIGTIVLIPMTILLAFTGFKKEYKEVK